MLQSWFYIYYQGSTSRILLWTQFWTMISRTRIKLVPPYLLVMSCQSWVDDGRSKVGKWQPEEGLIGKCTANNTNMKGVQSEWKDFDWQVHPHSVDNNMVNGNSMQRVCGSMILLLLWQNTLRTCCCCCWMRESAWNEEGLDYIIIISFNYSPLQKQCVVKYKLRPLYFM